MRMRTFADEAAVRILASNSSASYTQSWSEILGNCERVVYMLITHASANITFNVQQATDSSGTGAANLSGSSDVTASVADRIHTIEIGPGALSAAPTKQYVSPLATRSAGTYTLLEFKFSGRNPSFTLDSGWVTQRSLTT